ncbi:rhodanese-like domain-containing protein [Sporomusa sp.]|uniref:rhodanese-like domain-containing protein n=1 Tax=Sporomusa sp. TaxID=2078658 RepID=UPI002BE8AADA|nr:rhodanese-like domain-containing protein [Sporomusa sp.]HWR07650.1 rhodanese-like domain-containing protein [Sporomusa sp.]
MMERQKAFLTGGVMAIAITLLLWYQAIACGVVASGINNGTEGYANRGSLIKPAVLQVLLENKIVKVIDVRPPEQYQVGHIPGAVNIGVSDYADDQGSIPEFGHLAALLGKLEITNEDTLVLYAGNDKHGPAYSAHLWWLLDMEGCRPGRWQGTE